ncbi:MAG: IPT/TIG domain-containing protein [Terriglobales bacterium]
MARRYLPYAVVIGLMIVLPRIAAAGDPKYIAGVSYFNSGTTGVPLTWAQGVVTYYTDQGDLSPILPGASADALVADAISQWTSIPTAAVAATHAGQLAEDVNSSNVYVNSDGSVTMPADIMPTAITTPVGIVYDYDGSVTDALLGQGAGDPINCFNDAVFGGLDNLGTNANFLHALIVMNGNCALSSAQVPDVEYRLVRVLGRVLGLDWSQLNLNVITNVPPPTADDYAGFTIMHAVDSVNCIAIAFCYSDNNQVSAYLPKIDDQAALSRLYPLTSQNQANFPGKQIFSAATTRIHGSVYFVNATGQAAQGMQGVNVVARWINPASGLPSGAYAAASVSGFLFSGNVGNTVTGFNDPTGLPYNSFGSNDPTLEGFFDLAGLQIPNGASSAQYQLTVEPLDPVLSETVGPYGPWQVQPSGAIQPITVTVNLGGDLHQDILMQNSAVNTPAWFDPTTYASPATLPTAGDWTAALGPYGDADYFWFNAQTNRTLSVVVTALDDYGNLSETKAQPVLGMWALSDPGTFPAPANTSSAFNTVYFGETRLDAQILQSTSFRVGVADYRGDGRPDYHYHARVFYGDTITPARASVAGGTPLAIQGLGFQANMAMTVATAPASLLAFSATQLLATAPALPDGVQNVALNDAATGAASGMTGVLTYGAGPNDKIVLLSGSNPGTPVGGQAPYPVRVEVLASDGVTPVAGASVFFTSSPAVSFSACNAGTSCTVLSDQSGQASTQMTVLSSGTMTISVQLAPASYTPPQQVQATLFGTSSASDLSLLSPHAWIAQGATVNIPLTARVLSNGTPVNGSTVNYKITKGSGTLTSPSATTNSSGYATTTLQLSSFASDVQVSACVGPSNAPCQSFYGTAVPLSALQLQSVTGSTQEILVGQSFQPLAFRATDNSTPPNPVLGAGVVFQSQVGRMPNNEPILWIGQSTSSQQPMPVILSSLQATVLSDGNGLATIQPSSGGIQGAVVVLGSASVGNGSLQFQLQSLPVN